MRIEITWQEKDQIISALEAQHGKRGKNHGGGAVAAVVADDMLPGGCQTRDG